MLTIGSCAIGTHEPCQVRKEAAISDTSSVPRGNLVRVNCLGNAWSGYDKAKSHDTYLKKSLISKDINDFFVSNS